MQGDFTRLTFDETKNYSRVLMQQGRVQLDADWNEAAEIQLYLLRALAADLIGPHGGPGGAALGFEIGVAKEVKDGREQDVPRDFKIGVGHYYVDGILCVSDGRRFSAQPGFAKDVFGDLEKKEPQTCLVYLDVWERHVSYIEDEDENRSSIREVALRGLDTATRAQVVCQVRCLPITASNPPDFKADYNAFLDELKKARLTPRRGGGLTARARRTPSDNSAACTTAPEARYRGAENQLYRVEIHKPGELGEATFKWSRENGSVVFAVKSAGADNVALEGLGRDGRLGLTPDGWVEIVDDDYVLQNRAEPLRQIKEINIDEMNLILKTSASSTVGQNRAKHPLLRRWDSPGEITVKMDAAENGGWLALEDGIEIKFEAGQDEVFRTGDYWLIPARVATGDVEWPGPPNPPDAQLVFLSPHGIEHHYAPLAIISVDNTGKVTADANKDLRRKWPQLAK